MKNFHLVALCMTAILMYCCESESKSSSKSTSSYSSVVGQKEEIKADLKMRSQALAVIDHRLKTEPESYAIIEAGILNYYFVYNGTEISKAEDYKGSWIDYKPDFTYDYGSYDKVQGEGRYHYSPSKQQLVMVDNNGSINPQEWDIKSGGDVIIKVGTSTYGNNAFQIKLERTENKPTK